MAPFIGGAEVAAERLALGLRVAGHEVLVVLGTRGEVLERMVRANLRCVYAPMHLTDKRHWLQYVRARNGLRKVIRDFTPDLVHSNDLPTHQIVSDAARGLGIPRICHHRFPFGGKAIDWLLKFGAERHIFVSHALMEEMCQESAGLRSNSRTVVHDGLSIPPPLDASERARVRARLDLSPGQVIVAFTGQVVECKGVAELIRAWMLLPVNYRATAELLIIGDDFQEQGAYRAAMQRLAGELSCPARFVGFREDVGDWQCAADIAVVPSRVEPLGLVVMEAMARSRPVVGSQVGGIPEMIIHEENGLLVPPQCPEALAAALGHLIADPRVRTCYGEQGRRRCEEKFSLQVHVQSVLNEYRHCLSRMEVVAST